MSNDGGRGNNTRVLEIYIISPQWNNTWTQMA